MNNLLHKLSVECAQAHQSEETFFLFKLYPQPVRQFPTPFYGWNSALLLIQGWLSTRKAAFIIIIKED